MNALAGEAPPLLQRLWVYQAERIPLARTAVLVAVFSSASVTLSALLAGRPLAGVWAYALAFLAALVFMIQLRAADEVKDAEDDSRYRPERPVPRGLVTLREIVTVAAGLGMVLLALTGLFDLRLVLVLALVWLWLGLMSAEFFVPKWLRTRPFLYLVSHMLIMPLIDLFVTATEWLPRAGWAAPHGLWLFLALSFMNGCVLEIGRKIYAPASERAGVETYTGLLGRSRAVLAWIGCLLVAFGFILAVGARIDALFAVALPAALALAFAVAMAVRFQQSPTPAAQKMIDTAAGVWVLFSYGAVGFAPLILRAFA